jgi:hypothetical protein
MERPDEVPMTRGAGTGGLSQEVSDGLTDTRECRA